MEGRTEGRRKGWKERKEEGRKLGQKSVVASTPGFPLVCQACNLSLATFVLTCERDTPRGLCTHQRDSRCKKSLAEGKSLEKVRGQGGPLERWGLIPSFIYLPPLSRVHIPIVPFHLIGVLAWAVLDVVPLTVRHCI